MLLLLGLLNGDEWVSQVTYENGARTEANISANMTTKITNANQEDASVYLIGTSMNMLREKGPVSNLHALRLMQ